jgi:hypothetical protein
MSTVMLFHYNLDLAAVHRKTRGNHVAAHWTTNPEIILEWVQGLMDWKNYDHLKCILIDGCPSVFNQEATYEQYREMHQYSNHKSVKHNLDKVLLTMNKEDRKDHVLTFPAFLAEFIQDVMLTAQGFIMLPGKNDCLVFDASFLLSLLTQPFNHLINMDDEPEIIFGGAWTKYLTWIFNLRIAYPDLEIYLFDDNMTAAFRQPKNHPNVISGKAYQIKKLSLLDLPLGIAPVYPVGSRSPQRALPFPLSYQKEDYLKDVAFAPPPSPGTVFAKALPNWYNPGAMILADGSYPAAPFPMLVDDCLYAAVGQRWMRHLIRCSIDGLVHVMGGNDPDLRADQPDHVKFFRDKVSHTHCQLGYITNTCTMMVSNPEDKRQALLTDLVHNWGPTSGYQDFTLSEAAKLLCVLVSMCRVCPWGICLFQNLYHVMAQILRSNLRQMWNQPEFMALIQERDKYSRHPTDSSKYRFFFQKSGQGDL